MHLTFQKAEAEPQIRGGWLNAVSLGYFPLILWYKIFKKNNYIYLYRISNRTQLLECAILSNVFPMFWFRYFSHWLFHCHFVILTVSYDFSVLKYGHQRNWWLNVWIWTHLLNLTFSFHVPNKEAFEQKLKCWSSSRLIIIIFLCRHSKCMLKYQVRLEIFVEMCFYGATESPNLHHPESQWYLTMITN